MAIEKLILRNNIYNIKGFQACLKDRLTGLTDFPPGRQTS